MAFDDLHDQKAITELLHAYCRGVDSIDESILSSIFTSDCVVDYGPGMGGPRAGSESVVGGLLAGLPRFAATHHQISNIEISSDGPDRAVGVTYVTAWHRFDDGRPDAVLMGQYHDRFRKTDAGWRIAERSLLVAGQQHFDIEWRMIPRRGR